VTGQPTLAGLLQRAVNVHVQYYASLGQLAAESLDALFGTVLNFRRTSQGAPVAEGQISVDHSGQKRPVSTVVLEGEAGTCPLGVFLVENGLSHEVRAQVTASTFTAPNGKKTQPIFRFEPRTLRLGPREQMLVRMSVQIDKSLRPNVPYRGEVIVPDLPGTRLPVVLRRSLSSPPRDRSKRRVRQSQSLQKKRKNKESA
jgi:hypothetical protein